MNRAELIPSHWSVAQKAERGTAPLIMDPVSSLCSKMFKLHRISELQTQLYFLKTYPHETELMSANLEADNQSYQQSESLREGSFIYFKKMLVNIHKIITK